MNLRTILFMVVAAAIPFSLCAQPTVTEEAKPADGALQVPPLIEGEVRSINAGGQTLTLQHGEIPNLHLGPMTRIFHVKDPALLEGLQVGDKIRFSAETAGSNYLVTNIEKQ